MTGHQDAAPDPFVELGQYAAALCDGGLTPEQAGRVEELVAASPEARQFFLDYLLLHGELVWAGGACRPSESSVPILSAPPIVRQVAPLQPARRRPMRQIQRRILAWGLVGATAAILLLSLLWWGRRDTAPAVARITRAWNVAGQTDQAALQPGLRLAIGQDLAMERGLLEITFDDGTRALVEGHARLRLSAPRRLRLDAGRLCLRVAGQDGFTLVTPAGEIHDLGTQFGVDYDASQGHGDVYVFEGLVAVRARQNGPGAPERLIGSGQAVRLTGGKSGPTTVVPLAWEADRFVREFPSAAALAHSTHRLRARVAGHPHLLRHYTFEGATPREQKRDVRGGYDLDEAVMCYGRGKGQLGYGARGVDYSTEAILATRASVPGNHRGMGLQSERPLDPPPSFTLELLLRFDGFPGREEGRLACAVATRASARACGFYAVAAEDGTLALLLDGDAPWAETRVKLVPGEWHYVACVFEPSDKRSHTQVRVHAANLTAGQRTLEEVFAGDVPGTPPSGRLGIGKGFDAEGSHAYPWSGALDEIALYSAALTPAELQEHLDTLLPP